MDPKDDDVPYGISQPPAHEVTQVAVAVAAVVVVVVVVVVASSPLLSPLSTIVSSSS